MVLSNDRLLNRLAIAVLFGDGLLIAVTGILYAHGGLSLAWNTLSYKLAIAGAVLVAWAVQRWLPQRKSNGLLADLLLVFFLVSLLACTSLAAQYGILAIGWPLRDTWLAAGDKALGVDVRSIVPWLAAHPRLLSALDFCYRSLPIQFAMAPVALFALRRRKRAVEFLFNFYVCCLLALVGLALCPAASVFTYYGFTPLVNFTGVPEQIAGFRHGTMHVVRFDEIQGLISMPSFHTLGAMMICWAFRDKSVWLVPVAVLNVGLILGTILTGAHYAVDILAAIPVFVLSVFLYRKVAARLAQATSATPEQLPAREAA